VSTPPWRTWNWQKISGSLKRLLVWVLILGTWEAAYRIIGWRAWIFPAPSHVVDSLFGMLNIRTAFGDPLSKSWPWPGTGLHNAGILHSPLVEANLVSLLRLVIGFAISVVLGALLGILMWRFKAMDDFLGPLFLGMQTLPSVCWVPLGIIAFGYSEFAVQFVLVMGSFFAIAISLRDGLRIIPPLYQRAGLMLGAGGWRLYRYVLLPASLPALASGLRQGFAFAWRSLMGAEFVFVIERHGLGYLLQTGRDFNDVAQVLAIMIMMVVLGMLADRLAFARLERRVYRRFGLTATK
jgi:NitT/TauT family transport system permease protein